MEKQNSTVFWTKTFVVLIILILAYIGFETVKRSSFEYQKQSVLAGIKEFSNKYVKDVNDKKKIERYLQDLDEIFSKYSKRD